MLTRQTTITLSVDEQHDEIAAACQQYGIECLFVLGSAIRDDFRFGKSDIDLLVESESIDVTKKFRAYLDARDAFRRIFNADVDLVMGERLRTRFSQARLIAARS